MLDGTRVDQPLWADLERRDGAAALAHPIEVDVVIAGGGITGLTAALLIASDGRRVALLEADQIGAGTSGATSAHVTAVPDMGYEALWRTCGLVGGKRYVDRLNAALELMDGLVGAERIACDWARVPAYWYSECDADRERLGEEQRAAERLGQPCTLVRDVPLPWPTAGAVEFPRQARFHPLRYLGALAAVARARGVELYERTPVLGWDETANGVVVRTPTGEVRAGSLLLATHTPLGVNPVQAQLQAVQSYLVALHVPGPFPSALFWDTDSPYHYLRSADDDGQPVVLVGGADHRTGQASEPQAHYAQLVDYARARLPGATVARWWSAQLFEPADGLPYIGRSPLARQVYLATGFAGVGLAQGTMAAMELAALLRGEAADTPWKATRLSVRAAPRVLAEGLDTATAWIGDRLSRANGEALETLAAGEGRLAQVDGQRRAVYRDDAGRVHVLSPACPHLGCLVRWNGSARSWDCPCHGSRFAPTGEVLEGPALSGLARVEASAPYAGMPPITPEADAQRLDTDKG